MVPHLRSGSAAALLLPAVLSALFLVTLLSPSHVAEARLQPFQEDPGLQLDVLPSELDRRALLQDASTDAPIPTVVNTFEELRQAVVDGAENIEIRSHIDARLIDVTPPLPALDFTRSIRGNCTEEPSADLQALGASDLPLGQCVFIAKRERTKEGMWMLKISRNTWLDNLYLIEGTEANKIAGTRLGPLIFISQLARVWATQCRFQGSQVMDDAALNQVAFQVHGSAYLSGCRLSRFGGYAPVIDVFRIPLQNRVPHISLSNVLFVQNYTPDMAVPLATMQPHWDEINALIHVNVGRVRLEQCSFPQNAHKFPVASTSANGVVYAVPQVTVQHVPGPNTASLPLTDIAVGSANDALFPSERSAWFVRTEKALPSRQAVRATDTADAESGGLLGLSQGAHGAHAVSTSLHQLPAGDMAVAPADVVTVTTAKQLFDAVLIGVRDIVLTGHVDLSQELADDLGFVLPLIPSTRSIQGKCAGNQPMPSSLADGPNRVGNVTAGTCVIGVQDGLFRLAAANHYFWLDSVHLHALPQAAGTEQRDDYAEYEYQDYEAQPSNSKWSRRFLEVAGSGSLVFLSNVRAFGDLAGTEAVILSDASSAMHIEDSSFHNMVVATNRTAILSTRGALSLSDVSLVNLAAPNTTTALVLAEQSGTLTLQGQPPCARCLGNVYAVADSALVFADELPGNDQVFNLNAVAAQAVEPSAPPEDTTAALSLQHPWLIAVKKTLSKAKDVEESGIGDGDYSYSEYDDDTADLADSLPSDTDKGGPVALDPPPDVRSIDTAENLVAALEESVLDIVITNHIDLRGRSLDFISFVLTVGANTRSIRGGECAPVEGSWVDGENLSPPITDVTTGQCIILADFGVFHVFSHNHDIWFDQLYIRFVAPTSDDSSKGLLRHAFMISGQGSTSFLTGITVQGSGAQQQAGGIGEGVLQVSTSTSGAHMHAAVFQDLTVLDADNSFIKTAGPLSLNHTSFQSVFAPENKAFITVEHSGKLRLVDVEFGPDATGTPVFTDNTTSVWSDKGLQVKDAETGQAMNAAGLGAIPDPSPFTSLRNKWLQSLMRGLSTNSDSPVVSLDPQEPGRAELFRTPAGIANVNGSSRSSGKKRSIIAAIAGVLAALVLAAVAVVFAVRRYRARKSDRGTNGAFHRAWVENSSFSAISECTDKQQRDSNNGKNGKLDSGTSSRQTRDSNNGKSRKLDSGASSKTMGSSSAGLPSPSQKNKPGMLGAVFGMFSKKQKIEEPTPKMRHVPTTIGHKHDSLGLNNAPALTVPLQPLVKALDALCADKTFFLDVYVALGPASRKIGRDAVVQLFQHRMNKSRVAVKFYRTRATFDRERALRANADLSPICVPKIRTLADPGAGPGGYTWPPCIVLECGVNLVTFLNHVEQSDGANSAYPVACVVIAELAELVQLMHEVGFAHRKLRPENVMYIPERDAWSLTDIDRAARVGLMNAPAPPTEYTAPEVWKAMQLARTCLTTAAADVWAVGALAFELSTGERVLQPGSKPREAAFGLHDRAQAAAVAGKLGSIKDVIMECLHNDPQMRPTVQSIVPVLEAQAERSRMDVNMLQEQLAQLSTHAEGYTQTRVYLQAVCSTTLLPLAARAKLRAPPEQQPTATAFKSLIQEYCMALGPDTVTLPKGLPFRKERLECLKDINAQLNSVLKSTKL